ncbi:MAG: hypothetical protein PVI69_02030 [Desulfobacterales bacterium]|jgi:hypothetical protein
MTWQRVKGHFTLPSKSWAAAVWLSLTVLLLAGCTHKQKVMVPPRIELIPYNNIGIIEFSSNLDEKLRQHVTQNFMQRAQSAQPGVRFLELGPMSPILASFGADHLNPDILMSLAGKYHVNAVFTGHLEISEVKPKLRWNSVATTVKAEAYLEGMLTVRLLESRSGVILWTRSSAAKKSVAAISLNRNGPVGVSVNDPEAKYDNLVRELVYDCTNDFFPYYVYQKVHE